MWNNIYESSKNILYLCMQFTLLYIIILVGLLIHEYKFHPDEYAKRLAIIEKTFIENRY